MSQSPPAPAEPVPVDPIPPERVAAGLPATPPEAWWQSRVWAWVLLAVAAVALGLSVLLWQKLGAMQEELARRSLDAGTQAVEARTLARQAQEGTRDFGARLSSMEIRLGEVSLQRTQLEELMQSLSRSRDENLVIDIESALRLAQQQAQLTGSAEPLLAALKSAELRLQRAAQPRLNPVQRAIAKDAERIKSAAVIDLPTLLIKLDELARLLDELPVANAMLGSAVSQAAGAARPAPASGGQTESVKSSSSLGAATGAVQDWSSRVFAQFFSGFFATVRDEARKLLRVSRIDQPEAALLAPEQSFFLRENLKLRLLNARLALLSRQSDAARADLTSVQAALERYFDGSSRKTQVALASLQQVQAQLKSTEIPRLDQTLTALATAAAGR